MAALSSVVSGLTGSGSTGLSSRPVTAWLRAVTAASTSSCVASASARTASALAMASFRAATDSSVLPSVSAFFASSIADSRATLSTGSGSGSATLVP